MPGESQPRRAPDHQGEIHHEDVVLAPAAGVLPHRPLGVRKALVYHSNFFIIKQPSNRLSMGLFPKDDALHLGEL